MEAECRPNTARPVARCVVARRAGRLATVASRAARRSMPRAARRCLDCITSSVAGIGVPVGSAGVGAVAGAALRGGGDDSVALAGQAGAVAGPVHTAGAGAAGRRRGAAERRRASVSWLRPAAGSPPTRGGECVGGSCHIQTVNPRHQLWNAFLQPLWGATKYLDSYRRWFQQVRLVLEAPLRSCLAAPMAPKCIRFAN